MRSSSTHPTVIENPQLGSNPYFAYPTPSPDQIESELVRYQDEENFPLAVLLDRLAKKGNHDLRILLADILPQVSPKDRPKHIIEFAKSTRQALLKYLAVLRWKTSVDISSSTTPSINNAPPNGTSLPTPHSNISSNDTSPSVLSIKGKGKASSQDVVRGKVTDGKRIEEYFVHHRTQQNLAIDHIKHVTLQVETFRERNPDLFTSLVLLSKGDYMCLPTTLTEPYIKKPPLSNSLILKILKRLNYQIQYRLRCLDYLPPELVIEDIRDGKLYAKGDTWKATLTLTDFTDAGRWWLTGLEWGWKEKEKGVDDPGGSGQKALGYKSFKGEERQMIMDIANKILMPRETSIPKEKSTDEGTTSPDVQTKGNVYKKRIIDAPLVRLYNFLQHLSLSYQLETLFSQAIVLAQGKWRTQLIPELDREKKTLRIKYWLRERPSQPVSRQEPAAVSKNTKSSTDITILRQPLFGGLISISLAESTTFPSSLQSTLADISTGDLTSNERVLRLRLAINWTVGEAGVGGGFKNGDVMDNGAMLKLEEDALSVNELLMTCTRFHAACLTRHHATFLLSSHLVFPSQPTFSESFSLLQQPLTLKIPLPSRFETKHLLLGVSPFTGQLEIDDEGVDEGDETREKRAKLAEKAVRNGKKLADEIMRLIVAVVMEKLEGQMRSLGHSPLRQLGIRTKGMYMTKAELHPASTIFLPLPVSASHYLVAKVSSVGVSFELIKVIRVPHENGIGRMMVVGDQTGMDLAKLRRRRQEKKRRESRDVSFNNESSKESNWEVESQDLKDLFILSNALVAQTMIEQQLKDRQIPYTHQYPSSSGPAAPTSLSPLAGMIPAICVGVQDLLRGGKRGLEAMDVAMPKMWLRIEGWWTGKAEVCTVVVLRHQPSVSAATIKSSTTSEDIGETKENCAAQSEGISFDHKSSVVRFRSKDISCCVSEVLEQWERLSKVIAVAGEINRLSELKEFKDVKMLSFDLCTVILEYAPDHCASITYTPIDDSYQVTFFLASNSSLVDNKTGRKNPHALLSPLLSAKLNELTTAADKRRNTASRNFVGLLRGTLPIITVGEELDTKMEWRLIILGVEKFRLVKDHLGSRYGLDFTLLPDLRHYLIQDSSTPRGLHRTVDCFTGPMASLNMERIVKTVFASERALSLSPSIPSVEQRRKVPPLMRLDRGTSLVCELPRLERVMRKCVEEAEKGFEATEVDS
nr:hypothetical protein L203_02391 [Cryptococcus depauperatus CBS 7841]